MADDDIVNAAEAEPPATDTAEPQASGVQILKRARDDYYDRLLRKQAEFDNMYGKGISREGGALDLAVEYNIVKKSGAWYTYEGEQLGQGRENAKTFLIENPEIMVDISERVMSESGIGQTDDESLEELVIDPDDLPISLD